MITNPLPVGTGCSLQELFPIFIPPNYIHAPSIITSKMNSTKTMAEFEA